MEDKGSHTFLKLKASCGLSVCHMLTVCNRTGQVSAGTVCAVLASSGL